MFDAQILTRLESGLAAALPRWGVMPETALERLGVSENATYRASGTPHGDLVFRIHRPGYHTKAEIASELAWLAALHGEQAVVAPRPVMLRDGGLITDLQVGGQVYHVVAFGYIPGAEPTVDAGLAGWFRELGQIHARLHAHARAWQRPEGFVRKRWNFATTLGKTPLWGDWRASLGLDAAGRAHLQRAVDVLEKLTAGYGEREGNFGLIHADLRLANLLVDDGRLALIDFDDCGFSWFLYDFASAVSFIEHEPHVPALQDAWVEGYRSQAPLSDAEVALLPVFVMLRRLLLTAWIASRAETPVAQGFGVPYTNGTLALAEEFLARHG
ncbi:phosphotransferase enzyme family protein [Xanthobacteraceae bacterium A53D]